MGRDEGPRLQDIDGDGPTVYDDDKIVARRAPGQPFHRVRVDAEGLRVMRRVGRKGTQTRRHLVI